MSMWEPFTEAARRSIVLAQEAAQRLRNNVIAPEHIFIGIVEMGHEVGSNVVVDALATLGVKALDVRSAAQTLVGNEAVSQEMVFTPNAKRMIELAFEEARRLNYRYIGVEHLGLGYTALAPEAQSLLRDLGVDPPVLRAKILELQPEWSQPEWTIPSPAQPSRETHAAAHGDRLGDLLARIRRLDMPGMLSAVEKETQKRLYYIDTEDLWKRLQASVARRDVVGSLMYGLFIDHREQRDADLTFAEIVKRMDQNYRG